MTAPADPDAPGADQVAADQPAEETKPFFSVVSGDPSPEELAVLTLVLAAAASGGEDEEPKPVSGWASPRRMVRSIGVPGFGGWRAEFHPR